MSVSECFLQNQAPSRNLHSSRDAGFQSQELQRLAKENASLKEQIKVKEQSWNLEKKRLLKTRRADKNSQSEDKNQKTELKVLVESLQRERAAKAESVQRERDQANKVAQMEKVMKLLTQQNSELQVSHLSQSCCFGIMNCWSLQFVSDLKENKFNMKCL